MAKRYTAKELRVFRTIARGWTDNLKIDTGEKRVWLSRCTIADGMPWDNAITEETMIAGRWERTDFYKG